MKMGRGWETSGDVWLLGASPPRSPATIRPPGIPPWGTSPTYQGLSSSLFQLSGTIRKRLLYRIVSFTIWSLYIRLFHPSIFLHTLFIYSVYSCTFLYKSSANPGLVLPDLYAYALICRHSNREVFTHVRIQPCLFFPLIPFHPLETLMPQRFERFSKFFVPRVLTQ